MLLVSLMTLFFESSVLPVNLLLKKIKHFALRSTFELEMFAFRKLTLNAISMSSKKNDTECYVDIVVDIDNADTISCRYRPYRVKNTCH